MSNDKFYSNDTPAQLLARITNYEEGMADALKLLSTVDVHEVAQAREMLASLLQATGLEHLQALRQFEDSTAAVIAFKDRCLKTLIQDGCPCGTPDGAHTGDCAIGVALRLHPHMLPRVEETAATSLATLRLAVARIASELPPGSDEAQDLRTALVSAPFASN